MKTKKITSLVLSWSFLLLVLTSIVLYVMPQGKIAFWANWSFAGLDKESWGAFHTNIGYLFLFACVLHIYFNWKHIIAYLKSRGAEIRAVNANTIVSLFIVIAVFIMTIVQLPPVSWIQDLGHVFKDQAVDKYGSPPYGHAELSTLDEFCLRTGLDLTIATERLLENGIETSSDQTIVNIADQASKTPQQIAVLLQPNAEKRAAGSSSCSSKGGQGNMVGESEKPRFGMMTLKEACERLDLDYHTIAKQLKGHGYRPVSNKKIKDIAEERGERASAVMAILKPEGH